MTFNINICAPDQVIVGEEFSIYIEVITPYSRLSSSRQRQVSLLVDHKSCGMTWLVAGKTISSQLDFKYSSESYDGSNDDHGEGKRPIEYAEAKVKFRVIPLKEGHLLLPKFSLVMDSGDDMKKKLFSEQDVRGSNCDEIVDPNDCSVRWHPSSQPKVVVHPICCIKTDMMLVKSS